MNIQLDTDEICLIAETLTAQRNDIQRKMEDMSDHRQALWGDQCDELTILINKLEGENSHDDYDGCEDFGYDDDHEGDERQQVCDAADVGLYD